jgi:hypothetical protein
MIDAINSFWRSLMHLHATERARRRLAYPAAAALAIAAVAVPALATMPPASALTNRRICQYVWQQDLGKQYAGPNDKDPEHRMVSFVVNYKKDGECPHVDPHKVVLPDGVGQWMPFPQNWYPQPAPKMTCEEFQNRLQLPPALLGGDACGDLDEDQLYAVTGPLDTDHGPTPLWKKRTWPLGSVWKLQ